MRSISTDYMEPPPKRQTERAPVRLSGELRNGYRPRPSTIERSREIREIAARYIAEHGVWRFSMLSLAKHLNCLLPTLCYYYKKREELITDIVLRHVETLHTRTASRSTRSRTIVRPTNCMPLPANICWLASPNRIFTA